VAQVRGDWRNLVCAALLGVCAVLVYGGFQDRLDRHGLFLYDDVLFDADPGRTLRIMVHGQGWEGSSLQHPLWAALTHLPLRAVEFATRPLRPGSDADGFVRRASLRAIVLLGAVSTMLVFLTLRTLRLPVHDSVLASTVHLASFSNVVFGSVPEHWIISGAILSVVFYVTATLLVGGRAPTQPCQTLASVVAAAVTLSNGVLVLLPLGVAALAAGVPRRRAVGIGLVAGTIAGVTLALCYAVQVAVRPTHALEDLQRSPGWVVAHVEPRPAARLAAFPFEVANSVGPASLQITPRDLTAPGLSPNRAVGLPGPGWESVTPASVVLVVLLAAGGLSAVRLGQSWRAIGGAAAAVLAFNWGLHAVWGGAQLFVYSQHWIVVVPILLGALTQSLNERRRFAGTALLAVVAVGVALNSARLSAWLLEGMSW
jgi:hypothetical protein